MLPLSHTTLMEVEQGPRWLAELLYHPPDWLVTVVGLGIVAINLLLLGLALHVNLTNDVLVEMTTNFGIAAGAGGGAYLSMRVFNLSYTLDVGVGLVVGVVVGWGIIQPLMAEFLRKANDDATTG